MKSKSPLTVLVGLDFSDCSLRALDHALVELKRAGGGELHIVTVLDAHNQLPDPRGHTPRSAPAISTDEAIALQQRLLDASVAAKKLSLDQIVAFKHVRIGVPDREMLSLVAEIDSDLIVVGTHGRTGLKRLWLGSVADRLLRAASCPVLVVRPDLEPEPAEPGCDACQRVRDTSDRREWFCEEHRAHFTHTQPHRYSYSSPFNAQRDAANTVLDSSI